MTTLDQLDELANEYNKNKDKYVYDLWFKKVKEWADGVNNTKRRIVSVSSCHKRDDGTYLVIGRSRLHRSVRDTKNKINKLRR
jgi:hypothetical protein